MQPTYESNYQNQSLGAAANQLQRSIPSNAARGLNEYADYVSQQAMTQMELQRTSAQNNLNNMALTAMHNIMNVGQPLAPMADNLVQLRRSNGFSGEGTMHQMTYEQYSTSNQPMMIGPPVAVPPPPIVPSNAYPIVSQIVNQVEPSRVPQMLSSQYNLGTQRNLTKTIRETEMVIPPIDTHKPEKNCCWRICPSCIECQEGCMAGTKRCIGHNICCCCWPDPVSEHNRRSNTEFNTCCYSRCLCCYTFCPCFFKVCSCLPCCGVPQSATRKASDYPLPGDMGNRGCFGCCPCQSKKDPQNPGCCSALCPAKSCCRMCCRQACGIC